MIDRLNILLAEDDQQIARLVQFKLDREGFNVVIAEDGKEAIDYLLARKWALIILDVMMPVHDGWYVLKKLRQFTEIHIPVLMLTAKSYHSKDIANAAELGASQFLRKPFDPNELAAQVKRIVGV